MIRRLTLTPPQLRRTVKLLDGLEGEPPHQSQWEAQKHLPLGKDLSRLGSKYQHQYLLGIQPPAQGLAHPQSQGGGLGRTRPGLNQADPLTGTLNQLLLMRGHNTPRLKAGGGTTPQLRWHRHPD